MSEAQSSWGYENDLRYGTSDLADGMLDEYDQQLEEMWRIQAEWHRTEPAPITWGLLE
jgi:hypothetical protein